MFGIRHPIRVVVAGTAVDLLDDTTIGGAVWRSVRAVEQRQWVY
jgi:hypothetical protein